MRFLRVVLLLVLAFPGVARAADSIVARDVPLEGARTLAAARAPIRFELVGLHWRGPGDVFFRTRVPDGRWRAWRSSESGENFPDRRTAEARRSVGWRLGTPYWVGPSAGIQYRIAGRVRALRAYFVHTDATRAPLRTIALAGSPAIVPRSGWGADEQIRRAAPLYAPEIRYAVVHHTAGSNDYSRAQSAAIVRAIELYHVKGNGWNDIGYNFLVDKYGQVFEGRYGGIDRNVVGAHAQGFNTGSVGVSVLGSYGTTAISAAAKAALVNLLAWRLDLAHVDPLSTLNVLSGGNPRFPAGIPVFLRAIAGHRDTGFTDCPGDALYAQLPSIAQAVAATGLPKLYAPAVKGSLGGRIRFTATLSGPLTWTVTITDALGTPVASGTGFGSNVDWTWDSTGAFAGSYQWEIDAGPAARPATGSLGSSAPLPPPPLLSGVGADPLTVSPNGDGQDEQATVAYTLGRAATVTAMLLDEHGMPLATLLQATKLAGKQTFTWAPTAAADGHYRIEISARAADGTTASGGVPVTVDRTLSAFSVAPALFSPNGDGRLDTLAFAFALATPAHAELRVLDAQGRWTATVLSADLQPGPQQVVWDGRKRVGRLLDGSYQAELAVTDPLGTLTKRLPFTADSTPPRLRLLFLKRLDFSLTEDAAVTLTVNGARIRKLERAGRFHVPFKGVPRTLVAGAVDAAGNESAFVRVP